MAELGATTPNSVPQPRSSRRWRPFVPVPVLLRARPAPRRNEADVAGKRGHECEAIVQLEDFRCSSGARAFRGFSPKPGEGIVAALVFACGQYAVAEHAGASSQLRNKNGQRNWLFSLGWLGRPVRSLRRTDIRRMLQDRCRRRPVLRPCPQGRSRGRPRTAGPGNGARRIIWLMSRAIRRVPAHWKHPKDDRGNYIPLCDGSKYEQAAREWDESAAKWRDGLQPSFDARVWEPIKPDCRGVTYAEYAGPRPDHAGYTPQWAPSQCTHWQYYEEVTSGRPISPVCGSPEELARWMADHDGTRDSYENWLAIILQRPRCLVS